MTPKRLAVPAYYEIATDLRRDIESGHLRPGDVIPSEAQLCASYSVSRMTVRQGLNMLSEAGYIHSVPGKGSFVASPEFDRLTIEVRQGELPDGREVGVADVDVQIRPATAELADRLGIDKGSRVRQLSRILATDDEIPVGYERTFLPWAGTRVARQDELELPFAELVSRMGGRPFVTVQADLGAGRPDPAEAEVLNMSPHPFALYLEQTVFSPEEEVLGWGRTCFHPDRYAFRGEFNPFFKRF